MDHTLVVSTYFPADEKSSIHGVYQRLDTFVSALRDFGREIHGVFCVDADIDISPPAARAHEARLSGRWQIPVRLTLTRRRLARTLPYSLSLLLGILDYSYQNPQTAPTDEFRRAVVTALRDPPSIVFAHRLSAMTILMRSGPMLPPLFFDVDDLEHVALERRLRVKLPRRLDRVRRLHLPALRAAEARAIRSARAAFVCSDSDRDHVRDQLGCDNVYTVPNSTYITVTTESTVADAAGMTLLFVGTLAYAPNIDAAEWLTEQIWPRIYAVAPMARLFIAGSHPENVRSYKRAPPGVEFMGFVPNLDLLYQRCQVVVCPLRMGAGTRIKIIEAAANGKAIVSTRIGAEGLVFEDGREILIEDDPQLFAAACIRLLQDRCATRRLGAAARTRAAAVYDRRAVIAIVKNIIATQTGLCL